MNGSATPGNTKTTAKTNTENGVSDHDESDDEKEDEVAGGETGATTGCHYPLSRILHRLTVLSGQEEEKEKAKEEEDSYTNSTIRPTSSPYRTAIPEQSVSYW